MKIYDGLIASTDLWPQDVNFFGNVSKVLLAKKRDENDVKKSLNPIFRCATTSTGQVWGEVVNSLLSASFLINSSLSAPTNSRRGYAVFFRLIRLPVFLSLSELKEKNWLWEVVVATLYSVCPDVWAHSQVYCHPTNRVTRKNPSEREESKEL